MPGALTTPDGETVTDELTELDTEKLKSHDPVWLLSSCQVPDTEYDWLAVVANTPAVVTAPVLEMVRDEAGAVAELLSTVNWNVKVPGVPLISLVPDTVYVPEDRVPVAEMAPALETESSGELEEL